MVSASEALYIGSTDQDRTTELVKGQKNTSVKTAYKTVADAHT